jgi:hypothetical protein
MFLGVYWFVIKLSFMINLVALFSLIFSLALYCNFKMLRLIIETSTELMKIRRFHEAKVTGLKVFCVFILEPIASSVCARYYFLCFDLDCTVSELADLPVIFFLSKVVSPLLVIVALIFMSFLSTIRDGIDRLKASEESASMSFPFDIQTRQFRDESGIEIKNSALEEMDVFDFSSKEEVGGGGSCP